MKRERSLALLLLLALLAAFFFVFGGRYFGWVRSGPVVVSTVLW